MPSVFLILPIFHREHTQQLPETLDRVCCGVYLPGTVILANTPVTAAAGRLPFPPEEACQSPRARLPTRQWPGVPDRRPGVKGQVAT